MCIRVALVVESRSELLERVNMILEFGHSSVEALCQCGVFIIQRLNRCLDHVLFDLVAENTDLRFHSKVLVQSNFLL